MLPTRGVVSALIGGGLALCSACVGEGEFLGETVDESAFLFALDEVQEFELQIPPESWEALLEEPRVYQPGTFRHRGESWQVGVRLKGQLGSFRALDRGLKSAFKIDFDRYDPVGSFFGLRKLTLNNMVQDPSYSSEHLGYLLFDAVGVPVPRTGYAWLRVNGEDWGLYLNIESPDRRWVERHFLDSSGNLWEGSYVIDDDRWIFPDFTYEGVAWFEQDLEGVPEGRQDLLNVVRALENSDPDQRVEAVADVVDDGAFLRFCAAEVFLTHWDGYSGNTNNFRMYWDPTVGRLVFLPWGIDQTSRTWQRSDSIFGNQSAGLLLRRLLDHPSGFDDYLEAMGEVIVAYQELPLRGTWERLGELLEGYVEEDPRREFGLGVYEDFRADLREFIESQPEWMRELWIDAGGGG
jgi:spore coat protein CotH